MKAAWFDQFGSADEVIKISEQETPSVGKEDVLIQLSTSGVNPSDVKKRSGAFPNLLADGFVIPHSDGAGQVVAVGDGVSKERINERVWVYQAQFERRFGTAAEFLSINENRAIPLPKNITYEEGACLGIPAMTAHRCVFSDGNVNDKYILVTGGAGRVGSYAIQWAKLAGAIVIATASNDEDKKTCYELGAEIVVNHSDKDWDETLLKATGQRKIDRVIDVDFGMNLPKLLTFLKIGATIATYASSQIPRPELPFLQMMYMDLSIRMVIVYAMPESAKYEAIKDITAALKNNRLQHKIACSLDFNNIQKGHKLIESGKIRGCVVLNLS
tara:strand:- start:946 stop:1932 length:987 start_codon:yes stop_codon:yes gene_type:complete